MCIRDRLGGLQCIDCITYDLLSFPHDRVQMILTLEALCVNFINILSAGRTRCEPTAIGHNLETTDWRVVTRGAGKLPSDRLTRELWSCNCFG